MSPRPTDRPALSHVLDGPHLDAFELRANGWLPDAPVMVPTASADELTTGDVVELLHPEGVVLGRMTLDQPPAPDGPEAVLTGALDVSAAGVHYDHTDLRRTQADVARPRQVVVPISGIPSTRAVDELINLARRDQRPVLVLSLTGGRSATDADGQSIIRAHRLLIDQLRDAGLTVDHAIVPLAPGDASGDPGQVVAVAASVGDQLAHSDPMPGALPDGVDAHLISSPLNRSVADAAAAADTPPAIAEMLFHRTSAAGRPGVTVMFTGLSGSGKSTVAGALVAMLHARTERRVTLLDGDLVRRHLSSELGFSREHRDLNVTRIGFVAAEVTKHGGVAIAAPIAPYAETRQRVRDMVSAVGRFVLVHVATPLEVCEQRDRKGLYAKARRGEIAEFTGISDPYDEPLDADIVLDTSQMGIADAAEVVFAGLSERGLL